MNSSIKTLIFWVVLICVAVFLFAVVKTGKHAQGKEVSFTEFLDEVQNGQVKKVTIAGNDVHGEIRIPRRVCTPSYR